MTTKAKKISTIYDKYVNSVEYEYRGKTYWVQYPNDRSYCITPPHIQHKQEQAEIDKRIENESKPSTGKPAWEIFDEWHDEITN